MVIALIFKVYVYGSEIREKELPISYENSHDGNDESTKGIDISLGQFDYEEEMYTEEFRIKAIDIFITCDEAMIENLMERGYNVFITGIWDELIRKDSVEAVKYLLKYHFKTMRKRTFRDALVYGSESIVKVLIDKYKSLVKPDTEEEQSELVKMAVDRKFYWIIEKMAKEHFNVNTILPINAGRSILHDVVISGDFKMLKLLLKFTGLNFDARDDLGNTPLHYAKNMKIFKALLELYANPYLKNEEGINSIFMAQPGVEERHELFQFSLRNAVSKFPWRTFVIDRERVLEDSFDLVSREPYWYDVSLSFDICFKGETGIDGGGLKREWMSLLMERFFVPRNSAPAASVNLGPSTVNSEQITLRDLILRSSRVYATNVDEIYYGAPFECVDTSNQFYRISPSFTGPVEVYKFIGSVMAKSLLMKVPLRVKLVPSLVKLLFGKTLSFEDLEDDDSVMYRSMLQYLDADAALEIEDKKRYLESNAIDTMYIRFKDQIDAFIEGFQFILYREMLEAYFTPFELLSILSGSVGIDRSDLYRNIEISGVYWLEHNRIFWDALDALNEAELFEFVRFVTGINGLPFGGVSALGKKIEIQDEPVNSVPKASTCCFQLRIPTAITTMEELVAMLRMAFNSGPEFTY